MSSVEQFMIKPRLKAQTLTATAGQTVFNLTTISIPDSDKEKTILLIQGVEQEYSTYTVNSATQFTLTEGAEVGDSVTLKVISF